MLILNKLFRKQVKSFCLLLDQDPFISCVHFTTQSTSSSQVYKLFPSLSHSFPTVCFLPKYFLYRFEFIQLLSSLSKTGPSLIPNSAQLSPSLRAQALQSGLYSTIVNHIGISYGTYWKYNLLTIQ